MKIKKIANTYGGQDGAIFKNTYFRFDSCGNCKIYNTDDFSEIASAKIEGDIIPHANAVFFGKEYFDEKDEFPALYSNIYNNYANSEDKMLGTCFVYRVVCNGAEYSFELKQKIKLDFCDDEIWCSKDGDIRPYGNFVYDGLTDRFYAFNMMDGIRKTRYFAFEMPSLKDSEVVLTKNDIIEYFDCPYHEFIQGAIGKDGKIYSVEGFSNCQPHPAAIRVIDLKEKKQVFFALFKDYVEDVEPEFIDFCNDLCIYGDGKGNLYTIEFDI